jgi:tetratricopeptide (TPR) repeat protein
MTTKFLLIIYLIFLASCATNSTKAVEIFSENSNIKSESAITSKDSFAGVQSFMDGMLFFEQGDYARAIIEFQDSVESGSNSPEVYFSMSEAYWMLQKYDKSISLAKKAILLDDSAVDYKISLGKKYIALNNYELSLNVFNGITLEEPNNADILFIIGDLKAELNDIDGALLYYQEAYNVDNDLIVSLEMAAQLAYNSNHRDLPKIFKRLLLADPSNSEYMRGFLESKSGGNVEELIELLDLEELKANPFYNNLFNQIAFEFIRQGRFQTAEEYLNKSLSIKDDDRFALYYLSVVYREIARNDLALEVSRKHSSYYPNDKEGYINSTLALISMQRFNEAVDELNIAASLFPEDFEVNYFLGLANYSIQNFQNAEKYYLKSFNIDNNSIASMHGLAMTYDQNKEWEKSDELYAKLITLDDQDAQAYNNFAYSLVERGEDLDYALSLSQKAIEISPQTSAYLDTIGWIYYKLSDLEKAKEFISKAILYDDTSAVILEHYGDVLLELNEINEALIFYRKALLLNESNEDLILKISSNENQQ